MASVTYIWLLLFLFLIFYSEAPITLLTPSHVHLAQPLFGIFILDQLFKQTRLTPSSQLT